MTFARHMSSGVARGSSVSLMSLRRTVGAVAILGALLLAACATADTPSAEPELTPESTPIAPEPTEEPAPEENSAASHFGLSCEDVVPTGRVTELYGTEMVPLPAQPTGMSNWRAFASAAIADGALSCHWSVSGDALPTVSLTATVATAEEYAVGEEGYLRSFPRPSEPLPLLDGARAECSDTYPYEPLVAECGWSVFHDGVWIVAQFDDLPADELIEPEIREDPDTGLNGPTADPNGTAAAILVDAATVLAENALPLPSRVDTVVSCDDIEASAEVPAEWGTVTSVHNVGIFRAEEVGSRPEWQGGPLNALGMERQGWTECLLAFESWLSVTVTMAPSHAWVADLETYPDEEWVELANGDGVARSFADEGGSYSTVALVRGDNLFVVNARDNTTDLDLTEDFARSLATRLVL